MGLKCSLRESSCFGVDSEDGAADRGGGAGGSDRASSLSSDPFFTGFSKPERLCSKSIETFSSDESTTSLS